MTRRALTKWIFGLLAGFFLIPVTLVLIVLIALNTPWGQRQAEALLASALGNTIEVTGISGSFPAAPRVRHVVLRDADGVWLSIDDIALDWSPLRLLHGDAWIDSLTIGHIAVARAPVPTTPTEPSSSTGPAFHLPVTVDVESAHVARLDVGAALAGRPVTVAVDLKGHVVSLADGDADANIREIGGAGAYNFTGRINGETITAALDASEPAHGLISGLAGLPDLGAVRLHATVDGPWNAAASDVTLAAGGLSARAKGRVDISGEAADLDIVARAPAMAPRPDLSWQAVAFDAHVHGPFTAPAVSATLKVDRLAAAGAESPELTVTAQGDLGTVTAHAEISGLRVPGPAPTLFESAPLTLDATARLDSPDRQVSFTLSHALFTVKGTALTAGKFGAQAVVSIPDLAPFAAVEKVDLRGRSTLALTANMTGATTSATVDGTIGITRGLSPLPGLIGPDGKLSAAASLHGNDIALSKLQVDGTALKLSANGGLSGGHVTLEWTLGLGDLAVLTPSVSGTLTGTGTVVGATDALAATANITGEVATLGFSRAAVKLSLNVDGLPSAPAGSLIASGAFQGAPLTLAVTARRRGDGAIDATIDRATWKQTKATGSLALAAGAQRPTGRLVVHVGRLGDYSSLAGQPLDGSADIAVDLGADDARLTLTAQNAGIPGGGATKASLTGRVTHLMESPDVAATLAINGLRAGGTSGQVRVDVAGPENALAIRLTSDLENFDGAPLHAESSGKLDVPKMDLALGTLSATWKGETLRLLAPTRVSLATGLAIAPTRIGLRQAELSIAGKFSPTLDLTAALRNVSASLAAIVLPSIKAEGTLNAEARITGTPLRPAGTVHLVASGLRLDSGPAAGLAPATLTADARLAGGSAKIDARVSSGRNQASVTGTAPLDALGALGLRVSGSLDLAALDPILGANGDRARGIVKLDAGVSGTLASPRVNGSVGLAGGEIESFAQGVRVTGINATIDASDETIRITRFSGQAGRGTLSVTGTIGLAAPMPVDLAITGRDATPLASDRLTATLNADIAVRGAIQRRLDVTGTVGITSANVQVPENLPPRVAVLDVRRLGARPAPQASAGAVSGQAGPVIGLDVTLHAPGRIFVRGRGLDAELRGDLTVAGTTASPLISGGFQLRRGDFSIAGQSLTFTSGEVSFDGSGRIDPTLNFVATSSNASVTATLTISGYASAPKITLSSTPALPQDEILAQLLFHQSAASLSPFQLAEIAVALAQITGVGGVSSFDPLGAVRGTLGLDRLAVTGGSTGSTATLEAGRYVANGVYVGAKQATSSGGSEVTVQIDLTKGLKLETDVGSGGSSTGAATSSTTSNGTSVGLTYQFQY